MIYFLGRLLQASVKELSFLRLVDYLSVRSIAAALTAILLTLMLTPIFIRYLHRRRIVDQLRDTGIPSAFDKAGTPIMGGAVMVGSVLVLLLWCNLANLYLLTALGAMTWFGLIGLVDDTAKLRRARETGACPRSRSSRSRRRLRCCWSGCWPARGPPSRPARRSPSTYPS